MSVAVGKLGCCGTIFAKEISFVHDFSVAVAYTTTTLVRAMSTLLPGGGLAINRRFKAKVIYVP